MILADLRHGMRGTALSLLAGILIVGFLFQTEIVTAVQTWDESTAYNHCFMVIPIALYLLWDRRSSLAEDSARPAMWRQMISPDGTARRGRTLVQ